jgi:hypothetical protein
VPLRPPEGAAAAVQLRGHDKPLQRSDVSRRPDHLLQLVPIQRRSRQPDVPPDGDADRPSGKRLTSNKTSRAVPNAGSKVPSLGGRPAVGALKGWACRQPCVSPPVGHCARFRILNDAARSIIQTMRGQHPDWVFIIADDPCGQ